MKKVFIFLSALFIVCIISSSAAAQTSSARFKVIGFYTGKNDQAHISFLHEANKWFSAMAGKNNFEYDSTGDWNNMNDAFLKKYDIVIFLDTRPDSLPQRAAFERFMKNGGGWIGFHFSAFAMNASDVKQDWNWYHNEFLGSGEYVSNTWRPTSAVLKIENAHPVVKNFPKKFRSSPNEWYRWKNDLRQNPDIKVLLAIDSSSFPLGTGPKLHEIWHSGYYPVVWTNTKYKMIYMNMGHNDIDYEHNSNKELSFTFGNPLQDKLVLNSLLWLGSKK